MAHQDSEKADRLDALEAQAGEAEREARRWQRAAHAAEAARREVEAQAERLRELLQRADPYLIDCIDSRGDEAYWLAVEIRRALSKETP